MIFNCYMKTAITTTTKQASTSVQFYISLAIQRKYENCKFIRSNITSKIPIVWHINLSNTRRYCRLKCLTIILYLSPIYVITKISIERRRILSSLFRFYSIFGVEYKYTLNNQRHIDYMVPYVKSYLTKTIILKRSYFVVVFVVYKIQFTHNVNLLPHCSTNIKMAVGP